ncbi:uncharacterized protein AB9W97_019676 isoform 1-T1 [Spinachia spinachia]
MRISRRLELHTAKGEHVSLCSSSEVSTDDEHLSCCFNICSVLAGCLGQYERTQNLRARQEVRQRIIVTFTSPPQPAHWFLQPFTPAPHLQSAPLLACLPACLPASNQLFHPAAPAAHCECV